MTTHHTTVLHYLELLNNIASGERRAGVFLQAWADTTPDPELRACLSMVANRETSHYHIFNRRIAELGYSWTDNQDSDFEERLKVSGSDIPDAEKIRWGKVRQAQRQSEFEHERRQSQEKYADTVMPVDLLKPFCRGHQFPSYPQQMEQLLSAEYPTV
jgi:Mn-containing catalase